MISYLFLCQLVQNFSSSAMHKNIWSDRRSEKVATDSYQINTTLTCVEAVVVVVSSAWLLRRPLPPTPLSHTHLTMTRDLVQPNPTQLDRHVPIHPRAAWLAGLDHGNGRIAMPPCARHKSPIILSSFIRVISIYLIQQFRLVNDLVILHLVVRIVISQER